MYRAGHCGGVQGPSICTSKSEFGNPELFILCNSLPKDVLIDVPSGSFWSLCNCDVCKMLRCSESYSVSQNIAHRNDVIARFGHLDGNIYTIEMKDNRCVRNASHMCVSFNREYCFVS